MGMMTTMLLFRTSVICGAPCLSPSSDYSPLNSKGRLRMYVRKALLGRTRSDRSAIASLRNKHI